MLEEANARHQIRAAAGGRITLENPRHEELANKRPPPECRVIKQGQYRIAIRLGLGLDSPPNQQRNMNVGDRGIVFREIPQQRQSIAAGSRRAEQASWLRTSKFCFRSRHAQ